MFVGLWLGLACAATSAAPKAQAPTISCPPTTSATYQRVIPFSPDGPAGSLGDFKPVFAPGSTLRLLVAHLGVAHGGEAVPSEMLPPDELSYTLGRPMKWTIWDGRPPQPVGIVHLVCEYEGGLTLHRPLGNLVRTCTLTSAAQKPNAKSATLREVASKAVFSCR